MYTTIRLPIGAGQKISVKIRDAAKARGEGKTGLAYNSINFKCFVAVPGAAEAEITLAELTAVDSAFAEGGFIAQGHGVHRFDVPDELTDARRSFVLTFAENGTTDLNIMETSFLVEVGGVLDEVVEDSETVKELLRLARSAFVGKSTGGGTSEIVFKSRDGLKPRITAAMDTKGNRLSVTTDASD